MDTRGMGIGIVVRKGVTETCRKSGAITDRGLNSVRKRIVKGVSRGYIAIIRRNIRPRIGVTQRIYEAEGIRRPEEAVAAANAGFRIDAPRETDSRREFVGVWVGRFR